MFPPKKGRIFKKTPSKKEKSKSCAFKFPRIFALLCAPDYSFPSLRTINAKLAGDASSFSRRHSFGRRVTLVSARETWPYFQRESIARTVAWNAVRPGNIVSRIGFAPKIASAGRKFEKRRRERNSCVYIEGTANCLPQWILRFFGCNGVKWARFECRSIRFKEIRVDGLSGLLRKDRILPIPSSPRREFMGDADQICRRRRVISRNACVNEERRKRESERSLKDGAIFFVEKKKLFC